MTHFVHIIWSWFIYFWSANTPKNKTETILTIFIFIKYENAKHIFVEILRKFVDGMMSFWFWWWTIIGTLNHMATDGGGPIQS